MAAETPKLFPLNVSNVPFNSSKQLYAPPTSSPTVNKKTTKKRMSSNGSIMNDTLLRKKDIDTLKLMGYYKQTHNDEVNHIRTPEDALADSTLGPILTREAKRSGMTPIDLLYKYGIFARKVSKGERGKKIMNELQENMKYWGGKRRTHRSKHTRRSKSTRRR